jgi:hypothetical protein
VGHSSEQTGVTEKDLFASFAPFKAKPRYHKPADSDPVSGFTHARQTRSQNKEKQYGGVPGLMLMHSLMSLGPIIEDFVQSWPSATLISTTSPHNHTSGPAFPNFMPDSPQRSQERWYRNAAPFAADDICCATCVCG